MVAMFNVFRALNGHKNMSKIGQFGVHQGGWRPMWHGDILHEARVEGLDASLGGEPIWRRGI